jgi:MFS family permease
MYSEDDLRTAVESGAISADAANALRSHVATARQTPASDEENFRLINSFNDIFVTIAAVLLLLAMAGIGQAVAPGVAGLLVAGAAWAMAEFFTRRRRMALPSIVLLLAFIGGLIAAPVEILSETNIDNTNERAVGLLFALIFVGASVGAWLHWRRFAVPITVAAGAATVAATIIALIVTAIGPGSNDAVEVMLLPLVFIAGLAIFAYAMRWDISDRLRQTRRSDVAFWLHLVAAPMIAHPLFHWLGVTEGQDIGASAAVSVLLVYIAMGLVALAVDRRALLVSALAYVLVTLTWLFDRFGAVELNVALTALVIGSALLTLSAFWTPIRRAVVVQLPSTLRNKLPAPGTLVTT